MYFMYLLISMFCLTGAGAAVVPAGAAGAHLGEDLRRR